MNRTFRVLLADDEYIIIQSLKKAIPWEALQMEVVAEAKDGEEAYRLIQETRPDIILTDIRMPIVDGLMLMERVRKEHPNTLFIVISGYGEFEYAREALRMGAFDYVLKPIDHEELLETVRKAGEKLHRHYEELELQERLKHSLGTLSAVARERLYLQLIEGNQQPFNQMYWLEQDQLNEAYYVLLVQLDQYPSLARKWRQEERRLWLFAVRNILQEYGETSGARSVFPFHSGEWLLVFADEPDVRKRERGEEIVSIVKRHTKLSCSVGVSTVCQGMEKLGECYQSAQDALMERFYQGHEGVYLFQPRGQQVLGSVYPLDLEGKLIQSAKTLDEQRIYQIMDELKSRWHAASYDKEQIQSCMIQLIVVLYRELEHLYSFQEPVDTLITGIYESETLDEMLSFVSSSLLTSIQGLKQRQSRYDNGQLIDKVKKYIEDHYNQDLSVDEAAEVAGLSCSHFCTWFKKETGQTFLEYLTGYRMNKACYILAHSDVKVYQTAPLVGYQDSKYFTQVFKRMIGMTPTEYRETAASSGE
ncbi:response regulator [Marinicrinis lubricantis]|uniref:Response regulator n=1 Tax=Marinicrinis lubricantis TaxID=2086470 RepID=A0ABW1IHP4_9BACL